MPPRQTAQFHQSTPEVVRGHYQAFEVNTRISIQEFCARNGLPFKKGAGYYELIKKVLVQGTKKIILQDRATGKLYTGRWARERLGLPLHDEDVEISRQVLSGYRVFIQSTSLNRVLLPGQLFLYPVPAPKATEPAPKEILCVWDRLAGDEDLI